MYRDQLGKFVCGYWGFAPHHLKTALYYLNARKNQLPLDTWSYLYVHYVYM